MTPAAWFALGIVSSFGISALVLLGIIVCSWARHCAEPPPVATDETHRVVIEAATLDALAVACRKAAEHIETRCVAASLGED